MYYTTWGPGCGGCGHAHTTYEEAQACVAKDEARAFAQAQHLYGHDPAVDRALYHTDRMVHAIQRPEHAQTLEFWDPVAGVLLPPFGAQARVARQTYVVIRYAADGHAGEQGDGAEIARGTLDECEAAIRERVGDQIDLLRWGGIEDDGDIEAYAEAMYEGCGGYAIRKAHA